MQIFKLNVENSGEIEYLPLFKYQNHIFMVKQNFEKIPEYIEENKLDTEFDGFYKYNIIDNSLNSIYTSNKIMHYFFNYDYSTVYYISIEKCCEDYYAIFYRINTESEIEEKLFSYKLYKYIGEDYRQENKHEIRPCDIISQINAFIVSNSYIIFIIDRINEYDGYYYRHSSTNEFNMFVYDIEENEVYEVMDRDFYKHGFENIVDYKLNSKEYIIFNSSIYFQEEKQNYIYGCDMEDCSVRGCKDGIYIVDLDTFIQEVKKGYKKISYENIECINDNGSIKFLNRYEDKLYYLVTHFDRKFSEFVSYNLTTSMYDRKKIDTIYFGVSITNEGDKGFVYEKDTKEIIERSGKNWNIKKKINMSGIIVGVLKSDYVITKETKMISGKCVFYTNIYKTSNYELLEKIKGRAFILDQENEVIIW